MQFRHLDQTGFNAVFNSELNSYQYSQAGWKEKVWSTCFGACLSSSAWHKCILYMIFCRATCTCPPLALVALTRLRFVCSRVHQAHGSRPPDTAKAREAVQRGKSEATFRASESIAHCVRLWHVRARWHKCSRHFLGGERLPCSSASVSLASLYYHN